MNHNLAEAKQPSESVETRDVLLMIGGLHCGAHLTLPESGTLTVGSSDRCDIILTDHGIEELHFVLTIERDHVTGRVLDGTVAILGRIYRPGEHFDLPQFVALHAGDASLGWGIEFDSRWQKLDRSGPRSRQHVVEHDDNAQTAGELPPPAEPAPRRRSLVAGIAAIFTLVAIAVFGPMNGNNDALARTSAQDRFAALLKNLQLEDIDVRQQVDGPLLVTGVVPDDVARAALTQAITREGLAASLHLHTGQQLVEQVRDVFRINGMNVRAQYAGHGIVAVEDASGSRRVATIVERARHDIQGLADIRLLRSVADKESKPPVAAEEPKIAATEAVATSSSGEKRIASVVDDTPAYVLTADGSRYFVGATLPHGYRIVAISGAEVTMEKDGESVVMAF
jgi:type III secretion protein D